MEFNLALKKNAWIFFKVYWKGSTLPFTEVFIQNSSQRSAWNVQVLRTMANWCWWLFKHSEQQQQCFRLTWLDEHELLYPIRIQFAEFASQIDPQTALKAFLFYQIFHVNFLQFGLKTHHFGNKFSIFSNFVQAYSDPFRTKQKTNKKN